LGRKKAGGRDVTRTPKRIDLDHFLGAAEEGDRGTRAVERLEKEEEAGRPRGIYGTQRTKKGMNLLTQREE